MKMNNDNPVQHAVMSERIFQTG